MKQKRVIFLSIFLVIVLLMPSFVFASEIGIEDQCRSLLIGDFDSGKILEENNIDEIVPLASISKLMTYLVVKDNMKAGNISGGSPVNISKETTQIEGASFGLLEGEILTVDELLMGLMVVSGNDAAKALAIFVSGSEAAFVEKMNLTASQIGLTTASFVNASGLQAGDQQNSMSTRDLFQLVRHIIQQYPEILDYSAIRQINMPQRNFIASSTIPLVDELPGVDGLKTGFTEEAGYCLVSTMDVSKIKPNENYRLITIVMGAASLESRGQLGSVLLNYALEYYSKKVMIRTDAPWTKIKMNSARIQQVDVYPAEEYAPLLKKDASLTYSKTIDSSIRAPLSKGSKVGTLTILNQGKIDGTIDLVVHEDIAKANALTIFGRILVDFFSTMKNMLNL